MFDTIMSMGSKTRVSVKLGDGQFAYDAMVADEDPHLTVWKFEFFDGMLMVIPMRPISLHKAPGA